MLSAQTGQVRRRRAENWTRIRSEGILGALTEKDIRKVSPKKSLQKNDPGGFNKWGSVDQTRVHASKVKSYSQSAQGTTDEAPFTRNIHEICNKLTRGSSALMMPSHTSLRKLNILNEDFWR
jgi:hypothetical protein